MPKMAIMDSSNPDSAEQLRIPPLDYDFFAPPRIVFGWRRRSELGTLGSTLGDRAFIVTGSRTLEKNGVVAELLGLLEGSRIEPQCVATISHEPEVSDVDRLTATIVAQQPTRSDFVIGIGGGSAIDLAKAAAAMATNRESNTVVDYLEGVGRGLEINEPPLPMIAVPTTAGTGSEATKNAVISSYDPPFKKSLRSTSMLPRIVLIDPELSISAPPDITAHTGMDAITQLIESYISRKGRPIPSALCIQGLQLAIHALPAAVKNGANRSAREAMSHAALLSGIALANSGLGLAHGVAAALGVECRVPHGLACAIMLPTALRVNCDVREAELANLARTILKREFCSNTEAVHVLIEQIESLCAEIGIPNRLSNIGVQRSQIPALIAGSRGNSMAGNPRDLSDAELRKVLEAML